MGDKLKKSNTNDSVLNEKSNQSLLLSKDSVDEDYEIDLIGDDEQRTLLTDGTNKNKNGKSIKPKLTLKLDKKGSKKKDEPIGKYEDDDDDDIYETTRFKRPPNTPPPVTIGKIKIFNPGRRRRAIRFRRFIKRCFTIIFCTLFLFMILYNYNRLPEILRTAFGWLDRSAYQSSSSRRVSNGRCDHVVSTPVWRQNFPMLTIESALRLIDVNNDSVHDVIVPFGTGLDASFYDPILCQIYFNQTETESKTIGCGGGVMAIDGTNGEPLWAQYTPHELFATNCNLDINQDGIKDCIIGGRMASLYALDGKSGMVLWSINSNVGEPVTESSNFYTPLLIPKDIDSDSITDIIVMHGGDPLRKPGERVRNVARLMVISAKTGQILSWSYVPDNSESYYSPQMLVHPDGTMLIMYGTGGETHPGGLYVVSLDALLNGQMEHNVRTIFQDCCKGVMTPPVLIDINNDEIVDIVMAHFNSTVFAFDGLTFEQIWKREFVGGETYSSPSVGYFNDDNVPDFGVTYQYGAGFPIYYYAEFHVLDGRNGNLLLKNGVRMPIGTQSSPLTVSTFAQNDIFLFWYSSCTNSSFIYDRNRTRTSTNQSIDDSIDMGPFQLSPETNVYQSSRADFCKIRFGDNVKHYTQYRAVTYDSSIPIYDSRTDEPIVEKINFTQMAYQWYSANYGSIDPMVSGSDGGGVGGNVPVEVDDQMTRVSNSNGNLWGPLEQNYLGLNAGAGAAIKDDNIVYSPEAFEQLKKYKKWNSPQDITLDANTFDNQPRQMIDPNVLLKRFRRRQRRHVGLHNGDHIQRVISTGTLAPSRLPATSTDQLLVDGSIDVIFATYSFPPTSNVKLMSPSMRKCIDTYMAPEKEAQMRLLDDNSMFKQMGYDHDAYEAAVKEQCAKETGESESVPVSNIDDTQTNPLNKNDWIRDFGSMTVHRINLKCFERKSTKQIAIKEYRYQWWPSYLGILADAVANLIDE
ncbi:hypothetical protein RDWZM_006954 [Blomia tropicalis]|uniref:FAM234A/B beta-propeller domain-containing protein n=1 Tax=Blomia tropicalis TaxID=40697 RepID=A0A9Q0MAT6_BLOTA|nr:hypothetical protein RDWZM_006954 [Blomia tropicalis]